MDVNLVVLNAIEILLIGIPIGLLIAIIISSAELKKLDNEIDILESMKKMMIEESEKR